MIKNLYKFLAYTISATFPLTLQAGAPLAQACTDAVNKTIELCSSASGAVKSLSDASAQQLAAQAKEQFNTAVTPFRLADTANNSAANYNAASTYCRQTHEDLCAKICRASHQQAQALQPPEPQTVQKIVEATNRCNEDIKNLVAELDKGAMDARNAAVQAQQTGTEALTGEVPPAPKPNNNGGMSPMMAGLLGAALGGAAGFMVGKEMEKRDQEKKKDKEKDKDVVKEDGTVDCSKAGAEAYSDCNEYFENKCINSLTSEECKNFAARYCASSGTTASQSTPSTSDTGVIIASAADKDIPGEGVGTQFCFTSQATNFCAVAGRETCPSCLQLETNKAEVCASNPVLCLAQNNPVDIETAKQSCPSDPMFSNPDYVAGGGATVPNSDGLPPPVLPASEAASNESANDVAGGGGSGGGLQFTSADQQANKPMAGKVIGSNTYTGEGRASDIAGGGYSPSSAGMGSARHPTSMGGVMGPSLFSMSSAIIESRCKQGQLAHCSK